MVYRENIFADFPDHVVQVDVPKVAGGSVVESGVEIFVAHQFV